MDNPPLNVEFGAGSSRPAGYVVHDIEVDIRQVLPYADNSVDNIRAEHVCEHVSGPEFLRFLDECHRILKPGGALRLCMPVLDRLRHDELRPMILWHGHMAAYTAVLIRHFLCAAGFDICNHVDRDETDHHWRVIGEEKDSRETARIVAAKR